MNQTIFTAATRLKASGLLTTITLWSLLGLYALGRVSQLLAGSEPGHVPLLLVIVLHVVPALLFALIHGAQLYGTRAILIFFALFLIIGNVIENVGVLTGFPFGHYYFTERMGPKLFQVPITLGLAYLGMGYLSWVLAEFILSGANEGFISASAAASRFRVFAVPLTAAFVMVAWDFSMDPVWSTIQRCWIWTRGGAYFGVPVSNFLGWFLTNYVIYQLFALYLYKWRITPDVLTLGSWRLAVLFYGVSAAGNLLLLLGQPPDGLAVVTDPAGNQWKVSDIVGATALVSIFCMGAFAAVAWLRLQLANNNSSHV